MKVVSVISDLFIDGDGYVTVTQTIVDEKTQTEIQATIEWFCHTGGWEAFDGDDSIYETGEITYPTNEDFEEVEELIS